MKSQQYPMKSPSCTIYMGCNEISHHINSTKPLFFSFVSYDLLYPSYMPLYIIPVGTYWYGMWNIMGSHIANSVIIYHPSYTHYIYPIMNPGCQEKNWVPGPGAHATERSFVSPDQNEFDAKKCVEEPGAGRHGDRGSSGML